MSAAQLPGGLTAYVGAGGGGDTAAAVVRSLAHPAGCRAAVYGAGYSAAEYARSLASGVRAAPGSGRDYDRLPFGGDSGLIDDYLRDTGARDHAGRDAPVFQVRPARGSRHVAALFEGLRVDGSAAVDEQGAGFKHMSLLDECSVVAQLAPPHPVYIFGSVRDLRDAAAARIAYEALAAHLHAADTRRLVLIDFGADVLDFAAPTGERRPLARDTTVLLMALHMLLTGVIVALRLEVYGPGVDAHDTLDAVMHRLQALESLGLARVLPAGAAGPEVDAFVARLRQHEAPLARCGLLRRGRATANFLRAHSRSVATTGEDASNEFMAEWLEARDDFAKRSALEQVAFREATRRYLAGDPARAEQFRAVVLVQLDTAEAAQRFVDAVCAPEYAQLVAALEAR